MVSCSLIPVVAGFVVFYALTNCAIALSYGGFFQLISGDDIREEGSISLIHQAFYACNINAPCKMVARFQEPIGYQQIGNDKDIARIGKPISVWAKVAAAKLPEGPKDCSDIRKAGHKSGIYKIYPDPSSSLSVLCDLSSPAEDWIVIQRRLNGSTHFNRNWDHYKTGFGDLSGNMWIGLDNLHLLTGSGRKAKLRIEMIHFRVPNDLFTANYDVFQIGSEAEKYKLSIGQFSGDSGDAMSANNGCKFSTRDQDNDESLRRCAVVYKGGWWYKNCSDANLNGVYPGHREEVKHGITWRNLQATDGGVIFSKMKIMFKN